METLLIFFFIMSLSVVSRKKLKELRCILLVMAILIAVTQSPLKYTPSYESSIWVTSLR